jgi:hypothetical protein
LSDEQRAELEKGYQKGKNHAFRTRCQMILLKSENRTSSEVAEILECCEMSVDHWPKRYQKEGQTPYLANLRRTNLRRSPFFVLLNDEWFIQQRKANSKCF